MLITSHSNLDWIYLCMESIMYRRFISTYKCYLVSVEENKGKEEEDNSMDISYNAICEYV